MWLAIWVGVSQRSAARRSMATPSRICGTVIAGVHFFPPLGFQHQEPRGDERENLMVMPAAPVANFVMRQSGLTLAALDRFLDAVGRQRHAGEFLGRCSRGAFEK